MSLRALVAALGGDLYQSGLRANVPAPGHSSNDRSVSLLLDGDRLVIHGFGAADWREVRDHLRGLGLIDAEGRLQAGAAVGVNGNVAGRAERLLNSGADVPNATIVRPMTRSLTPMALAKFTEACTR